MRESEREAAESGGDACRLTHTGTGVHCTVRKGESQSNTRCLGKQLYTLAAINLSLLARINISAEASPRPLGAPYAHMHPRRTTSAAARTAPFHPPANRDSFKDLLVFEERLKQNAQRYARPDL